MTENCQFNPLAVFPKDRGIVQCKDAFNNKLFYCGTAKTTIRAKVKNLINEMRSDCPGWSKHRKEAVKTSHGVHFDFINMEGFSDTEIYDVADKLDENTVSQKIKQGYDDAKKKAGGVMKITDTNQFIQLEPLIKKAIINKNNEEFDLDGLWDEIEETYFTLGGTDGDNPGLSQIIEAVEAKISK